MNTLPMRRFFSIVCAVNLFISLTPGIGMAMEPNNPPGAENDSFTVLEDSGTTAFDVLANDTCAPDAGETLTITEVGTSPAGCTVSLIGGVIRVTPAANFNGTATLTYTVSDGSGDTDNATVTVTVTPANDPPAVEELSVPTLIAVWYVDGSGALSSVSGAL